MLTVQTVQLHLFLAFRSATRLVYTLCLPYGSARVLNEFVFVRNISHRDIWDTQWRRIGT